MTTCAKANQYFDPATNSWKACWRTAKYQEADGTAYCGLHSPRLHAERARLRRLSREGKAVSASDRKVIENAIRVLVAHGYTVVPPASPVVVEQEGK